MPGKVGVMGAGNKVFVERSRPVLLGGEGDNGMSWGGKVFDERGKVGISRGRGVVLDGREINGAERASDFFESGL